MCVDACKGSQLSGVLPAVQVFKITLEYWNFFVPDVFSSVSTLDVNAPFAFGGPVAPSNRKALYATVLSKLRLLMITRMAKPEEVKGVRCFLFAARSVLSRGDISAVKSCRVVAEHSAAASPTAGCCCALQSCSLVQSAGFRKGGVLR